MKQKLYLLYLLRVLILILIVWIASVAFSSPINKEEKLFHQELIQQQKETTKSLRKAIKIKIRSVENLLVYRPDDKILLEYYFLIENACNLTLDTLNQLFVNQSISNRELTSEVKKLREHLDSSILRILKELDKSNPIITNKEILHIFSALPSFDYHLKENNRQLLHEFVINQIEQIKIINLYFIAIKIGGSIMHSGDKDPIVIFPTFRKNKAGKFNVVLSTVGYRLLGDSLKINNQTFRLNGGVSKYSTVYKDTLLNDLIVEGDFHLLHETKNIRLKDTFKIYPNYKY